MSWDNLVWRPADATTLEGAGALADLLTMIQSALEESVSALIMGPATIAELAVTEATASTLPDGFAAAASFELLGTTRRGVWVALEPSSGTQLGDAQVDAPSLTGALLDGLDGVLAAMVGEGLSLGSTDAAEMPADAELFLLRLTLRDAAGLEVKVVGAVESSVPVELNTHVVALQALGPEAAPPPPPGPASQPVATAPAAPAMAAAPSSPAMASSHAAPPAQPAPPPARPVAAPANVRPVQLDELPAAPQSGGITNQNIELLMGVSLQVTVEIGRTRLPIRDVLALTPGSIVELDKLAGEKVDVLVNGHQIASGEVVVVDENFGVRITDVVSRQRRVMSSAWPA